MKTNNKRKVFGDAVDLLMDEIEEREVPRGIQMIQIRNIQPFHDHPFHLYEGERLEDMIASVKEHGILNPVIVQKIDGGYEMLSGHNRMNAAKLAGLKEVPAIVKTDLSEEEAYVYVIETNLMQRSFSDLLISEKAAVLKARYEKESCQGRRNDIIEEIARLEGKEVEVTRGHGDHRMKTRDTIGKEYELSGSSVGRLLKLNDLINTGHYWYLHCTEYPMEQSLIIFHKHFFKCPYHQHGRANTLNQAVRSIREHDKYQLEVRKCV